MAIGLHLLLLCWQLPKEDSVQPSPQRHENITVSLGEPQKTKKEVLKPEKVEKKATVEPKSSPPVEPRPSPTRPQVPPELELKPKPKPKVKAKPVVAKKDPSSSPQTITSTIEPVERMLAPEPHQQVSNEINSELPLASLISNSAPVIKQAMPFYKTNPPPKYPRMARRRGLEGIVMLKALISISGEVAQLELAKSSGYAILDKAALAAVRNWQFTSGTKNGVPHESWVTLPVRFKLQ